MHRSLVFFLPLALLLAATCLSANAVAQTSQFTYQGQLSDGGSPANGLFDLQFKLFDAAAGGGQQGATVTLDNVQVTNGLFSVTLNFGPTAFPGADRFLEIGVRPGANAGAFTLLTPRQPLTSTPYAIRSLSAATADGLSLACVNCVTSGQINSVAGSKVTGAIPVAGVPAGSGNYIQNNPSAQQVNSSFNISGDGLIGGQVGIGTTDPQADLEVSTGFPARNPTLLTTKYLGSGPIQLGTPSFIGRKARGTSSAPSAVQDADVLALFGGRGYGSNSFGANSNGAMSISASQLWTNTAQGARITFQTTPNNSATPLERLRIDHNGNVGIGITNPSAKLHVDGDVTVTDGTLSGDGAGLTRLNAANITTGTLATARGGTGLATPGAAGNYLRSNGANWISSPLLANDLPGGSTDYIQNRTAQQSRQSNASFNISGNGTVGGTLAAGEGVDGTDNSSGGTGVVGRSSSTTGIGVRGLALASNGEIYGVHGMTSSPAGFGVYGSNTSGIGVKGVSTFRDGVFGTSLNSNGVNGQSNFGNGVFGISSVSNNPTKAGVYGEGASVNSVGVLGQADNGSQARAVYGKSRDGHAGYFEGRIAVYAKAPCAGCSAYAGLFDGDVTVNGYFYHALPLNSRIDHPLDPENKYLRHAAIESSEALNIYNGNVTTDASGEALVILPDYFEALNRDFRYQLTAIGQFAQAIVASKIKDNRFTIKTDKPNIEVSWQVSGVRQDPSIKAKPLVVEEDKAQGERGYYVDPAAYGQPQEKGVSWIRDQQRGSLSKPKENDNRQQPARSPNQ